MSVLIGIAAGLWILSCAAAVLGVVWNLRAAPALVVPSFICSLVSIAIGYVGISRIHLAASKTVNGHVQWSINSKWFFVFAICLGAASLLLTFWNTTKTRRTAGKAG